MKSPHTRATIAERTGSVNIGPGPKIMPCCTSHLAMASSSEQGCSMRMLRQRRAIA
jgi:hypothetical protein